MKKIITRAEREKIKKRNQLLMGVILVILMVFSTIGFALSGRTNSQESEVMEYKNIKFIREGGYWRFNYNNKEFISRYNPVEVKDINVPISLRLEDFFNKPLYLSGNSPEVFGEINIFMRDFVERINLACIEEEKESNKTDICENLPIKDCKKDNIIIVKESKINESERIYQEDKCIFIESSIENQTLYGDALLFKIFDI